MTSDPGKLSPSPTTIRCAFCERALAEVSAGENRTVAELGTPPVSVTVPSCEELLERGAVAVPNFGWFCSQDCGDRFAARSGLRFQRDAAGKIRYY